MPALCCILEGQGDVGSIPLIVRRIAALSGIYDLQIQTVRVKRNRVVRPDELEKSIEVAARLVAASGSPPEQGGILVCLDADDDLPCVLGPELSRRARNARPDLPTAVVLACREKECWFIGAIESLHTRRGLNAEVGAPRAPEGIRGAKQWMSHFMDHAYSETTDQAAFSTLFDLEAAARSCPSFARFRRAVERLLGVSR